MSSNILIHLPQVDSGPLHILYTWWYSYRMRSMVLGRFDRLINAIEKSLLQRTKMLKSLEDKLVGKPLSAAEEPICRAASKARVYHNNLLKEPQPKQIQQGKRISQVTDDRALELIKSQAAISSGVKDTYTTIHLLCETIKLDLESADDVDRLIRAEIFQMKQALAPLREARLALRNRAANEVSLSYIDLLEKRQIRDYAEPWLETMKKYYKTENMKT